MCTIPDPRRRPSLTLVAQTIRSIKEQFTPRRSHKRMQSDTFSFKVTENTGKGFTHDQDLVFLQQRVPFITEQYLRYQNTIRYLGCGANGSVTLIQYQGSEAVVKHLFEDDALREVLFEARCMVELNGAGGAPRLKAVCLTPAALVMDYVGKTYDKYVVKCSLDDFLNSLISISERLGEVHAKGIIHNDLKAYKITFTGTISDPTFHIIDFGWASNIGEPAL